MKTIVKKVITPAIEAVTEDIEVEISFPFYSKSKIKYYKLPSEKAYIVVDIEYIDKGLAFISTGYADTIVPAFTKDALEGTVITEEEFNEAYAKAKELIKPQTVEA